MNKIVKIIVIVVIVLGLEEWAYFKSHSKLMRAVITGVAVFALLLVLNFFWPSAVF